MSEIDPIYKELASKIGMENSENIQRILAKLANLDQAKLVRGLPDPHRDPSAGRLEVSEELAKSVGMDKATADKHIQELYEKGLIFPTGKGPQMARTLIQLHDASLANPKYDKDVGDEFFKLWAELDGTMRKPKPEDLQPGKSVFRVIPRRKSIEGIPGVLPQEDVTQILKAQDVIAVIHCPCKRSHPERECGIPDECCITLGGTAKYNIARGTGRQITVDEALEIMDKYDEYQVINSTINQKEVNQLICNCHWDCCPPFKEDEKSRFVAVVDGDKCKGCKICVDRCQFGAIQMEDSHSTTDAEICRGCGCCVVTCPSEARTMKLVRPGEHIPESLTIY